MIFIKNKGKIYGFLKYFHYFLLLLVCDSVRVGIMLGIDTGGGALPYLSDNGFFMRSSMKLFLLTGFFLFITSQIPPAMTQSNYPRYINRAENKCFYGEAVQDRLWDDDWLKKCSLPFAPLLSQPS